MAADPMVIIRILASGDMDVVACGNVRLVWIDETSTPPDV